ncbi:hypothetical protein JOF56_003760 [Kibdelosporangium banguiense]|uniref:Uncharacterized protein n=1 Tax=Kibdelosporangium banguiense TaxID=1365924 RepID=A0ABS4TH69_9PSEU|nr:hypothetical protein [Kibdelosporangium banguiense]MBP2323375.1 hypothetical protein [Kibdelosporangium banguiense]
MKTPVQNCAKRLATLCHSAADRLLDLGLLTFESQGTMTVWDLAVVRVAYGLLVLGNLVERASGREDARTSPEGRV